MSEGAGASDATAPGRMPAPAWAEVLRRTWQRIWADRLPQLCAAVAFFAVLSVAPVLVTALSVYGTVNDPEQALEQLSAVAGMLPDQLEPIVADQLVTITTASTQVLTWRGLAALVIALWTATMAAVDLIDALTVAYHERETRGLLHRAALALAFVLGGALLLGGVIALAGAASDGLAGTSDAVRTTAQVLVWPALAVLMAAVLAVLYRFAPDRRRARWRWISWGAATATVLWVLSSAGLFAYVQSLGTYEATYGSLAGVAISMFWLWLTVFLVVAGGVLNAESERQTARDSTVGPERPLGQRGAVVADSVPPYPDGA
ncbi:YihY/virulence factor BrkB family protein [Geodermatophilus sp. YIM 151500]|uniref:YihY/virulence factor BrkB family protein n=1 Tax=Geodermatophilus sp. YIM 151500 TaxID=2984531 RepID=UPI0021E3714E|nr:YihY/virulence factor BrkB family protein [Geodermatophilus sp. YIM 151500]MCV2489356.1 YihY/virulence factor BrkB family protein [Geodermatophilus sp. YIM 151500]